VSNLLNSSGQKCHNGNLLMSMLMTIISDDDISLDKDDRDTIEVAFMPDSNNRWNQRIT